MNIGKVNSVNFKASLHPATQKCFSDKALAKEINDKIQNSPIQDFDDILENDTKISIGKRKFSSYGFEYYLPVLNIVSGEGRKKVETPVAIFNSLSLPDNVETEEQIANEIARQEHQYGLVIDKHLKFPESEGDILKIFARHNAQKISKLSTPELAEKFDFLVEQGQIDETEAKKAFESVIEEMKAKFALNYYNEALNTKIDLYDRIID